MKSDLAQNKKYAELAYQDGKRFRNNLDGKAKEKLKSAVPQELEELFATIGATDNPDVEVSQENIHMFLFGTSIGATEYFKSGANFGYNIGHKIPFLRGFLGLS